jgi:hypothetical protein
MKLSSIKYLEINKASTVKTVEQRKKGLSFQNLREDADFRELELL